MTHWPQVTLGEVVVARPGNGKVIKGTLATESAPDLYPAYSATGQDVFSEEFDYEGDGIVISAVGARCGKCFLANGRWQAIANTHVLLPRKDKVQPRFLWYLINNEDFWTKGGTAQPFVKMTESLRKMIPLPPLPEQDRLVCILDEAQALRNTCARARERIADAIPALFDDFFGHPLSNPKKWELVTLDSALEVLYRYPTFYGTSYVPDGVPVAKIGNILPNHQLDPDLANYDRVPTEFSAKFPKTVLSPGDLVMAVRGDTTGKIAYVPATLAGCNISPNLIRMRPRENVLDGLYLLYLLLMAPQVVTRRVTDTAKKSITAKNIGEILIPLPPISMQRVFALQAREIHGFETAQEACCRRLGDLFDCLLHHAFEGDL